MSIRPIFSDRILSGEKRFEIRRRPVRLRPDDLVVVYASAPVKAVVGAFTVKRVHIGSTEGLWRKFSQDMGVDRSHYLEYLSGVSQVCAIEIGQVIHLPAVELADLRAKQYGFRPPQSYMFLGERHEPGLGRIATDAWKQALQPT